ncbi:hypothetical protein [Nocardia xishanensis]
MLGGVVADPMGLHAAVWVAAAAALLVAVRMHETHQPHFVPQLGTDPN